MSRHTRWGARACLVLILAGCITQPTAASTKVDPGPGADWFWNMTGFAGSQELTWSLTRTESISCGDGATSSTTSLTGSGSFRLTFSTTRSTRFASVWNRPDGLVGGGAFVAQGRSLGFSVFDGWPVPATSTLTGTLTRTYSPCAGRSALPPQSERVDGCGAHPVSLEITIEPGAMDRSGLPMAGYLRYRGESPACPTPDDAARALVADGVDLERCADYRQKASDALAENAGLLFHRIPFNRTRLVRPRGRTLRLPAGQTLGCTFQQPPTSTDGGFSTQSYRLEITGTLRHTIMLTRRAHRARVR